ncbi:HAD family hydrolase [Nocardioides mangrovicus]|uniref:HAD family hydrolase n=1 Tax=Nocardioides mangrovicus TaxID=2478913 RepID=A0A3L8P009_9ACTN|nr:HAD-IA family hydrolase [Nocardioides mangrovicus]RLV48504.1 HAD family hydrolase [Nocardioides mangrovicus]
MPALLLGSISTIADTSELQRSAFNQAFVKHGLDWEWSQEEYRGLLTGNGGADRIAAYARQRGEQVDAAAVHQTKSEIFQRSLADGGVTTRPGVRESVAAARDTGWAVGLVTTTSRANIDALLAGLDDLGEADFDIITDVTTVDSPKPSPDVYAAVLDELGEDADGSVAVEDNVGGVEAATAAGLACVAFPNENTEDHDFGDVEVVASLDFAELRAAHEEAR